MGYGETGRGRMRWFSRIKVFAAFDSCGMMRVCIYSRATICSGYPGESRMRALWQAVSEIGFRLRCLRSPKYFHADNATKPWLFAPKRFTPSPIHPAKHSRNIN